MDRRPLYRFERVGLAVVVYPSVYGIGIKSMERVVPIRTHITNPGEKPSNPRRIYEPIRLLGRPSIGDPGAARRGPDAYNPGRFPSCG